MFAGWTVILAALFYLCLLFMVAHFGDTWGRSLLRGPARPIIYALTLAVFCTSWTFYGSVGLASHSGYDFLAIYLGPLLVMLFGQRLIRRVVRLSKSQNLTSVADFVSARYGKSERVGAIVCLIAVIGSVPYIALQLKAVSTSLLTFLEVIEPSVNQEGRLLFGDLSLFIALILAAFAAAFGTRHVDATEHQNGLMLAVAAESVVKLVCFLAVGIYVTFVMFDGPGDIFSRVAAEPKLVPFMDRSQGLGGFLTLTLLSSTIILLLPRQFHVTVVENRHEGDIARAGRTFPAYLIIINIFVIPLALAADLVFPNAATQDMAVLQLPLHAGHEIIALLAFIGGLSAATAMVIVACVALSIMVSNELIVPMLLRRRRQKSGDMGTTVLVIRRAAILAIMLLGYAYFRHASDSALAAIGLISFVAIAQIAPAFFGGMLWRRGNALGATAGLLVGFATWFYTLFLPSLADPDTLGLAHLLSQGPFDLAPLRPTNLFGLDMSQMNNGVFWSMGLNVLAYVGCSYLRPSTPLERLQASMFVSSERPGMSQSFRFWRSAITVGELQTAVARYLGDERTIEAFQKFMTRRGLGQSDSSREADIHLLRFAEHQLASAIGASSSRLVLSLLMRRRNVTKKAALRLLDDASAAIQYNRDLLQHALDHARQGITVFDRDLRLMCWNREFQSLFEVPDELAQTGVGLDEIVRYNASRGLYGDGAADDFIAARLESLVNDAEPVRVRLFPSNKVVEIRSAHMPDGGIVTTYTDVTETVEAEEALERANETLERRVKERTEELTRLNDELGRAKAEAEEANTSKTRFLAAASHDILQPLNAARLYATSLLERDRASGDARLAENVDASLEAVEEILTALLDISRLDSGTMKAEVSNFRIDDILNQLKLEFEPLAREKGLDLRFVPCSRTVRSDRRLLRRLLQNLISNAIKYTPKGKVLVGCHVRGNKVVAEVRDTGLGIPQSKQRIVFREFQRLDQGARAARGLGLGLSIVERIGRVLDHKVRLQSQSGQGSMFCVEMPLGPHLPPEVAAKDSTNPILAPLAGMIVLSIDNEPAILEGMRTLLSGWGCTVLTAASLAEAQQTLKRRKVQPDIMIADYHLDEGDGIEALVALRWKLGRELPAILLTADRSPPVRDAAAEKDIHVMHKPLKPAALRALLAQWRASRAAAE